ncbi:TPA: hypothetical protein OV554_003662 [Acinetobacter baumannii]|nr:hypothetical protein [Acinetobacter baumannii]
MQFKNYKLNINDQQPLAEILKELERLGYTCCYISPKPEIVYTENGRYHASVQTGDNEMWSLSGYVETTLVELKKMEILETKAMDKCREEFETKFGVVGTRMPNGNYSSWVHQAKWDTFQAAWQHQQAKVEEQQKAIDEKDKLIGLATAKWNSVISIMTTMDMIVVPDEVHQKLDELGDILKGITPET